MLKCLVLGFFCLAAGTIKAQSAKDFFDTGDYRHTVNYPDHKVTFFTLPSEKFIGSMLLDRKYYWYSNNHINTTQGGFSGKLLHGLYSDFYEGKGLKEQGIFKQGLKQGNWKAWTDKGTLISSMEYLSGQLNGKYYKYDLDGKIAEQGNYKEGKLNGKLITYLGADSTTVQYYRHNVLQASKNKREHILLRKFFGSKKDKTAGQTEKRKVKTSN
ncbi:toxin-antitoxin system YwqK family antitoxin [Pedobacter sp. Leaf176]|uniref:toxin-antitoxin system YwqK family antitoxin n=1 Tax=Pedobacter sp. Leaf176 TaxID=1736286 RepID=UPI0006F7E592|nr:hypothetical protein [Pedobacter sp. Leaf176]KQR70907.1 hypothetical protein ASF92_05730 [Pedobacter sp. Leaf176]